MNAFNLILITSGKKSEATAHIWVVSIDGQPHSKVLQKPLQGYALRLSPEEAHRAEHLRQLPHPRLSRDCASQGCRHRSCERAHRSQCGRTAHPSCSTQAHEKACQKAHDKESQSFSLRQMIGLPERVVFSVFRGFGDICRCN